MNGKEPTWLVRVVEWFEKDPGNALLGWAELKDLELAELQARWGMSAGDPMLESIEVTEDQRLDVERWAGIGVDLANADYFVSAYARDWDAARTAGGYMGQFPPPMTLPAFPGAQRIRPKLE